MNEQKLNKALQDLPREVQPARDLWPGVQGRIRRRRAAARPAWSYGLAASLLVAVTAGGLWAGFHLSHRGESPGVIVASGSSVPTDPYLAQRAAYAEQSVQTATDLSPATRAVILKNLRIIESSLQDIQAALDKDPNNPRLRALLFDLYQNEARLLASTQQAQAKTNARNSL